MTNEQDFQNPNSPQIKMQIPKSPEERAEKIFLDNIECSPECETDWNKVQREMADHIREAENEATKIANEITNETCRTLFRREALEEAAKLVNSFYLESNLGNRIELGEVSNAIRALIDGKEKK